MVCPKTAKLATLTGFACLFKAGKRPRHSAYLLAPLKVALGRGDWPRWEDDDALLPKTLFVKPLAVPELAQASAAGTLTAPFIVLSHKGLDRVLTTAVQGINLHKAGMVAHRLLDDFAHLCEVKTVFGHALCTILAVCRFKYAKRFIAFVRGRKMA